MKFNNCLTLTFLDNKLYKQKLRFKNYGIFEMKTYLKLYFSIFKISSLSRSFQRKMYCYTWSKLQNRNYTENEINGIIKQEMPQMVVRQKLVLKSALTNKSKPLVQCEKRTGMGLCLGDKISSPK